MKFCGLGFYLRYFHLSRYLLENSRLRDVFNVAKKVILKLANALKLAILILSVFWLLWWEQLTGKPCTWTVKRLFKVFCFSSKSNFENACCSRYERSARHMHNVTLAN